MLECEGYKMFRGTATVTPKNPKFPTVAISGTWLYKPEYDCWYVNGRSYMADIVSDFVKMQPTVGEWISVEERLPGGSDTVLVLREDGYCFSAEYDECIDQKDRRFGIWESHYHPDTLGFLDSEWISYEGITHWMPLPAPPEVE